MRFAKFLGQTFLIHLVTGAGLGLGAATMTVLVIRANDALSDHQDAKNETPTPKDNS